VALATVQSRLGRQAVVVVVWGVSLTLDLVVEDGLWI
jgi:hypothetical protein